jgi:hypothetical protein
MGSPHGVLNWHWAGLLRCTMMHAIKRNMQWRYLFLSHLHPSVHTQGVERTGQRCWASVVPRVKSIDSSQALCLLQCIELVGGVARR